MILSTLGVPTTTPPNDLSNSGQYSALTLLWGDSLATLIWWLSVARSVRYFKRKYIPLFFFLFHAFNPGFLNSCPFRTLKNEVCVSEVEKHAFNDCRMIIFEINVFFI